MRIIILHPAIPADATLEDQDSMVQVEAIAAAITRLGWQPLPMPCTLDLAAVRRDLLISRGDAESLTLWNRSTAPTRSNTSPPPCSTPSACPTPAPRPRRSFKPPKTPRQATPPAGRPANAGMGRTGPSQTPIQGPPLPSGEGWGEGNAAPDPTSEGEAFPGFPSPRPSPGGRGGPLCHVAEQQPSRRLLSLDHQGRLGTRLPRTGRRKHRARGRGGEPPATAARAAAAKRPPLVRRAIHRRAGVQSLRLGRAGGSGGPAPGEIDFSAFPPDKPRIVGHAAKWREDSFEFHHTPRRFDFPAEDEELLDRLRGLARSCWELFRLRGYARVDFRVDGDGQPWILEINTNPCLSPDAGFAAALERAGIAYDEAIRRIVQQATAYPRE